MLFCAQRISDATGSFDLDLMTLAVIKRQGVRFVAFRDRNCQRGCRIKSAAQKDDCTFHRPSRPSFLLPRFLSGYSARTVSPIPPRAENCAVTIASRGADALTKSSRMRFVTASLKARSFRYEARKNFSDLFLI